MRASLWLVALLGTLAFTTPIEVKWTPADKEDDAPLPLSASYREKLAALEAKVGPEKFRELTGMAPPSTQTAEARSGGAVPQGGGGGLNPFVLASLVPAKIKYTALTVASTALLCAAWNHYETTGFRLLSHPCHVSLIPPPKKYILSRARGMVHLPLSGPERLLAKRGGSRSATNADTDANADDDADEEDEHEDEDEDEDEDDEEKAVASKAESTSEGPKHLRKRVKIGAGSIAYGRAKRILHAIW